MSDQERLSVLLAEPDPESRLQIIQIISAEGFQVDAVETREQLMSRETGRITF